MTKKFCGNKKRLTLTIFGILLFWIINVPISYAGDEIECATEPDGVCKSHYESCILCSAFISTCTVNADNLGDTLGNLTAINACGWTALSDPFTHRCKTGACPNSNAAIDPAGVGDPGLQVGDPCVVRILDGGSNVVSTGSLPLADRGVWDDNELKCIRCAIYSESKIYGDSAGIYYDTVADIWNEAGDGQFDSACAGVVPACDEKVQDENCGGTNTCDATGLCVAATCPVGDFTCQNECTPVDSYQCSGAQLQKCITTCDADTFNDWCNTAKSANEVGKCNDGVDNDCDGNTDGADSDCTANCLLWPNKSVYKKGQTINLFYAKVDCSGGSSVIIKDKNGATKKTDTGPSSNCNVGCAVNPSCGWILYTILAGDPVGTWTGELDSFSPSCTNNASFIVVECFDNSDCAVGETCNASGVCAAAATPNCNQLACGGAVSNQPCKCGERLVSANGDYCCAASNYYGDITTCKNASNCNIAASCNNDNVKDAGEACDGTDLAGETCADFGFVGGTLKCSSCVFDTSGCANYTPPVCNPNAWFLCNTLEGTVDDIFQAGETMIGYILGIIGSVALLLIIISGVMYMTSMGNEEKITTSKKILTGAVIGLAIALLSYSLLQLVISIL